MNAHLVLPIILFAVIAWLVCVKRLPVTGGKWDAVLYGVLSVIIGSVFASIMAEVLIIHGFATMWVALGTMLTWVAASLMIGSIIRDKLKIDSETR